MKRFILPFLLLGLLAGCSEKPGDGDGGGDGGFCTLNDDCPNPQVCSGGVCSPPPCTMDGDCDPGERCNLIDGSCGPAATDGGTDGGDAGPQFVCDAGATRCAIDGTQGVDSCAADRLSWEPGPCSGATPVCLNAQCVACAPGAIQCNGDNALTCRADGSGFDSESCPATGARCVGGVCQLCTPNTSTCKDPTTLQICNSTGTGWTEAECVDGFCDGATNACVADSCNPGEVECQGDNVMVCNVAGSAFQLQEDCLTTSEKCVEGVCVDPCTAAEANRAYIGCEYWPTILSNSLLDPIFYGDFAVVVVNPSANLTANIEFYAALSVVPLFTGTVAPGALETFYLPWNMMDATQGTQMADIAYKMTSSVPVAAYQFNPLRSSIPSGCTSDADCLGSGSISASEDTCDVAAGICVSDYSYTNDASLLLPAHVYGDANETPASTYLAMSLPHIQAGASDFPAYIAIVASSPGTTTVNFKSRGATAAGAGLPAMNPGDVETFSMNQFDVIQIVSRAFGTGITSNAGVTNFAESDLTGSLITSDKPVGVFSGADCHFIPYAFAACDHLEESLFPFKNWGSRYVASRTLYRNNISGDIWKIVAAVDGTIINFDPPPPPANPTTITLNAGEKYEVLTTVDFEVTSQDIDHPIMVAQFLVGVGALWPDPGGNPNVGDPSMILAIPTQQYKDNYTFTTPLTIAEDFINIVRPAGLVVNLDGVPLNPATGWAAVGTTNWEVARVPISDGVHTVDAAGFVGLTVYGFDSSVSYGYPGGLDLKNIVTVVIEE